MKASEPTRAQPPSAPVLTPTPTSDILNVGELVCGDYEILRLVGASHEGETYETRHQITGQVALVKALPVPSSLDPQGDERVKAEAKALSRLVHPNLLSLINFRREGPRYVAVIQVPEGQPLEAQLLAAGPLALPRFFRIFEQVLDGMAYAHEAGLPHGGLSAQEIFVDGSDRVKISGFARFSTGGAAEAPRGLAAARFLAPEQIRHHLADERTDLYAIGVLAFLALTGRPPFDGLAEFDVMRAHLEEPIPDLAALRPAVPLELVSWVRQALAKDPADRAPSATSMLEQLRQVAVLVGMSMMSAPVLQPRVTPPPSPGTPEVAASPVGSSRGGGVSGTAVPSLPLIAPPPPSFTAAVRGGRQALSASGGQLAREQGPAPRAVGPPPGPSLAHAAPLESVYPGLSAPRPAPPPVSLTPAPVQAFVSGGTSRSAPSLAPQGFALGAAAPPSSLHPAPPPVRRAPPPLGTAPAPVAPPPLGTAPAPVAPPPQATAPAPVAPPPQATAPAPAAPPPLGTALASPAPKEALAEEAGAPVMVVSHRQDPMRLTPAGGLLIQKGDEADFFGAQGESEEGPDDFSDLEEAHPRSAKRRRLIFILAGGLIGAAALSYFLVGALNPYGRGGDSTKASRPEGWLDQLTREAYLGDPGLVGDQADSASGPARGAGAPPAMTSEAMTPEAMTPEAMTPDAMVSEPPRVLPGAGNPEAATLGAEAQKLATSNRAKAEELAERALKLDPSEPVARKVLAGILEGKAKNLLYAGRNADAVNTAQRATLLDPERPEPWFLLGVASHELRQAAQAKQALEQYLKRCPKCGYNSTFAQQILQSLR